VQFRKIKKAKSLRQQLKTAAKYQRKKIWDVQKTAPNSFNSGGDVFPYNSVSNGLIPATLLAVKEGVVLGYDRNDHNRRCLQAKRL